MNILKRRNIQLQLIAVVGNLFIIVAFTIYSYLTIALTG